MKKLFKLAVCFILTAAVMMSGLCFAGAADKFYSKAELLLIKNHIEDDAGGSPYSVVQGACTDGKYAYFALMNGGATILKYNVRSWEFVEAKKISNVGHANDMTYNPDKGYIAIANNSPYYDTITLLDPEKLEVIKDVQIKEDIYSIAYNPTRKQYVVGISGSYDFTLLDQDFNILQDEEKVKEKEKLSKSDKKEDREKAEKLNTDKVFKGTDTGCTRQGCDCDDDYIYFVQSGGGNVLAVYDYEGEHLATVPIGDSDEIENIFHVGNTFYTTMYYYGSRIRRLGFSDATRIAYKVNYDSNGGDGEMESTTVRYGTKTKLRKNTFRKEGYFFSGWRVQRDSDGKYIGFANGSDKFEWLPESEVFDYLLYFDEEAMAETVRFGDLKLTAAWINEEYGVDFDTDGGEGHMEPMTVGYHDEFTLPESGFYKEGYVFDGYSATRDLDGRTYGYRAGSDKPEWLNSEDIDRMYLFRPGDTAKELTTDGRVSMTARYKFAYTFGDDGSTLVEYVGVDEKVSIPGNSGELKTLAGGAIKDNEIMTELYIPAGVRDMRRDSVTNCPNLRSVYFEGALPEKFDSCCISGTETPVVYRVYNGQAFCIGFYSGEASAPLIRCHSFSVQRSIGADIYVR